MNSDFEKRLQGVPPREIPSRWRAKILAAAQPAQTGWRQWLWPCPQAWAGLGAAWLVIFGMNLAAGRNPPPPPSATLALSRQQLRELRQEQRMLAEMIFPEENAVAEPPKKGLSPRGEARRNTAVI